MLDDLNDLHIATYDQLADMYEERVEVWRRIMEYALMPLIEALPRTATVLDVGCAVGYTLEILNNAGLRVEGIDLSPKMVNYARKRNPQCVIRQGDFLQMTYKPQSYDAVLMGAFLHLFPKHVALECLARAKLLLKPGGLLFVGTTKSLKSSEGFEKKIDYSTDAHRYRKRWTVNEMSEALKLEGFSIKHYEEIQDEYGKTWMDFLVQKPKTE